MARQHAKGRHALGECQRSGKRVPYRDLVEDGHVPGLLVARDWYEPQHPQEIPPDMSDPIALRRPAPEISVPDGEGSPELGGAGTCAVAPESDTYVATTTLAAALSVGQAHIALEDAVTYAFAECIYIQRDDGSWYVSKATSGSDSPTYSVDLTTGVTLAGSAFAAGNDVYIGVTGGAHAIPLGAAELLQTDAVFQDQVNSSEQTLTQSITLPAGDNRMLIIPFMAVPVVHAVHGEEGEIVVTYGGVAMTVLATNRAEQMTTGVAVLAIEGVSFSGTDLVIDLGIDYGDFPTSVVEITGQPFVFGNVLQSDDDLDFDAVADNDSEPFITLPAVTPSRIGDLVFSFGVKKSLQFNLDFSDTGNYALVDPSSDLGDFTASSFCSGAAGRSAWSVTVSGAQTLTWTQGSNTSIGALAFVMRAAS